MVCVRERAPEREGHSVPTQRGGWVPPGKQEGRSQAGAGGQGVLTPREGGQK